MAEISEEAMTKRAAGQEDPPTSRPDPETGTPDTESAGPTGGVGPRGDDDATDPGSGEATDPTKASAADEPGEQDSGEPIDDTEDLEAEDPEDVQQRLDTLESQLAATQEKLEETKQLWLRSRADYDNLKRRSEREREDILKTATARLLGELLPPIEILDRAARELSEVDEAHAKGIQMAVSGLRRALEREGLQEVPTDGVAFDPSVHEAVAREPSDAPAGTVIEVVRPGYLLNDRLLQAALVKVSQGPENQPGPQDDPEPLSDDS